MSAHPVLTPADLSLARQGSYALLGRLFIYGLRPDDQPVLEQLPELAPHLPAEWLPDELAADHQALFGFDLPPFASIFLSEDRLLGGTVTDQLSRDAARLGYTPTADGAIDHIGEQLLLLAELCGAEAAAYKRDDGAGAGRWAAAQQRWLGGHLLRWLLPFQACLADQGKPFYKAVGQVALTVAADHWSGQPPTEPAWTLPEVTLPLDRTEAGLKDIAQFIMTPVQSGFFLTKSDVSALGRPLQLPRGFGSRDQMMTNLFRAAAQYDAMSDLLTALQQKVATQSRSLRSWLPRLAPFCEPWLTQLAHTDQMLARMQEQVVNHG